MKEHKRRNRSLFQNYLASYVGIAFISCALIGMLLFFFSVHELNIAQYRSTEHKAQLLIDELNNQYRNKPMPTDVLSFPLGENGVYDVDESNGCKMLGDIVISMERAQEQATLYGHPLQREVAFLTVHSMLHLLGYDHVNGGMEQVRMREREEAVLAKLGLERSASYV